MKKWIALSCMIACILGLTACGGEEKLTAYEQQKVNAAKNMATELVIPCIDSVLANPDAMALMQEYTSEEVEYSIQESFGMIVDGNAFVSALNSFSSTYGAIGDVQEIGEVTAQIDGDTILVNAEVIGSKKNAQAEIILSNDFFFSLKAAALNEEVTMGDLIGKAALNTLLGMGTVFCVLILISLIISCFNFIPKIQAKFARKEDVKAEAIESAVTRIESQEEVVDETDDCELAAVIAAAIAASEGAVSTDGFVVRSIRRRRAY